MVLVQSEENTPNIETQSIWKASSTASSLEIPQRPTIIAIDFDSTIARVIPPILTILNRRLGKNLQIEDVKEYPLAFERLGLKKEFFQVLNEVHKSESLEFIDKHTRRVLEWLIRRPDVDVRVLTGNQKIKAIEKFFEDWNMDIQVESSFGHPKTDFAWDILVDDDPQYAGITGRTVITFSQIWNTHVHASLRARDWNEVRYQLEYFI